jgi:hypothetical protein
MANPYHKPPVTEFLEYVARYHVPQVALVHRLDRATIADLLLRADLRAYNADTDREYLGELSRAFQAGVNKVPMWLAAQGFAAGPVSSTVVKYLPRTVVYSFGIAFRLVAHYHEGRDEYDFVATHAPMGKVVRYTVEGADLEQLDDPDYLFGGLLRTLRSLHSIEHPDLGPNSFLPRMTNPLINLLIRRGVLGKTGTLHAPGYHRVTYGWNPVAPIWYFTDWYDDGTPDLTYWIRPAVMRPTLYQGGYRVVGGKLADSTDDRELSSIWARNLVAQGYFGGLVAETDPESADDSPPEELAPPHPLTQGSRRAVPTMASEPVRETMQLIRAMFYESPGDMRPTTDPAYWQVGSGKNTLTIHDDKAQREVVVRVPWASTGLYLTVQNGHIVHGPDTCKALWLLQFRDLGSAYESTIGKLAPPGSSKAYYSGSETTKGTESFYVWYTDTLGYLLVVLRSPHGYQVTTRVYDFATADYRTVLDERTVIVEAGRSLTDTLTPDMLWGSPSNEPGEPDNHEPDDREPDDHEPEPDEPDDDAEPSGEHTAIVERLFASAYASYQIFGKPPVDSDPVPAGMEGRRFRGGRDATIHALRDLEWQFPRDSDTGTNILTGDTGKVVEVSKRILADNFEWQGEDIGMFYTKAGWEDRLKRAVHKLWDAGYQHVPDPTGSSWVHPLSLVAGDLVVHFKDKGQGYVDVLNSGLNFWSLAMSDTFRGRRTITRGPAALTRPSGILHLDKIDSVERKTVEAPQFTPAKIEADPSVTVNALNQIGIFPADGTRIFWGQSGSYKFIGRVGGSAKARPVLADPWYVPLTEAENAEAAAAWKDGNPLDDEWSWIPHVTALTGVTAGGAISLALGQLLKRHANSNIGVRYESSTGTIEGTFRGSSQPILGIITPNRIGTDDFSFKATADYEDKSDSQQDYYRPGGATIHRRYVGKFLELYVREAHSLAKRAKFARYHGYSQPTLLARWLLTGKGTVPVAPEKPRAGVHEDTWESTTYGRVQIVRGAQGAADVWNNIKVTRGGVGKVPSYGYSVRARRWARGNVPPKDLQAEVIAHGQGALFGWSE